MRVYARTLLILSGAASVAGCGSTGIFDRERPDEFAVTRQVPLVVPPDFTLVPPRPGAPRSETVDASQQAMEALFGGPAERSAVEREAISRAGTAAPGIRSTVGDPDTNTVAKGAVTRDILAAPQGDAREAQAVIPG